MRKPLGAPIEDYYTKAEHGCWIWTGSFTTQGYGQFGQYIKNGPTRQAHVLVWQKYKGPVPKGLELDHLCRNRKCVNPDHLEPVTRAVNTQREARAKLSQEKARSIREEYAKGGVLQQDLAIRYGVSQRVISGVVRGNIWLPEGSGNGTKKTLTKLD
jgi:hypothetical protein